jgi:hypothetical protein
MTGEPGKRTFYCPHCGQKLSFLDGTMVRMDGVLESPTFSVRTQFFLPAELGRYGAIVAGDVEIRDGARVEFFCSSPRCDANFTTTYNADLAEIRMVDEHGREFVVVFNKIYGRRATFVVDWKQRKLVDSFGEHAARYAATFERSLNYFGA